MHLPAFSVAAHRCLYNSCPYPACHHSSLLERHFVDDHREDAPAFWGSLDTMLYLTLLH